MSKFTYEKNIQTNWTDGYFIDIGNKQWEEYQAGLLAYSFVEKNRDNERIYLHDRSRDIQVSLPLLGGMSKYKLAASAWTDLFLVTTEVWEWDEFVAFDGTRAAIAGRLVNFKTGEHQLQSEHRDWLKNRVLPTILNRPNAWIDLYGFASKKGNAQNNLQLSKSRAEAVKNYLAQQLRPHGRSIDSMVNMDRGFGEDAPGYIAGESDNALKWRAVDVIVFGSKPTTVRPPNPQITTPGIRFEIRLVAGISGSLFLQADDYVFQIVDIDRRLTAYFQYSGAGLGIAIPKIPGPGSVSYSGDPSPFHTDRSVELHQFNSTASLYQDPGVTIGSEGIGGTFRLAIKKISTPTGFAFTNPRIIPIKGGAGIQMPGLGSATEGVFALISQVFPFRGY